MRSKKNNATSIDKRIQTIVYNKIIFFAYEFAYENQTQTGKGMPFPVARGLLEYKQLIKRKRRTLGAVKVRKDRKNIRFQ